MRVSIISTSDVHGYVRADDFRRPLLNDGLGLTRAATVIAALQERASHGEAVVTIENGDFIQGSPLTNYVEKQAPEATGIYQQLADAVGYDVRVFGNHEFNYGRDYLERVMADTPQLLNANVLDAETHQPLLVSRTLFLNGRALKLV